MNESPESVSIIGGADGPTAVFLAGKMGDGFKTGIIIFVTAMLILAAVMVLWKPGVKTKYRFIRLSAGNLLIHLMDGLVTFVNTPDLAREGNILVSRFGFGWGALFTANLLGFLRLSEQFHPDNGDYYMKLFYGENYKPSWFWFKFCKRFRPMFALVSYAAYWGLTAGAPVFVIGWLLHMAGIYPFWFSSTKIAGVVYVAVAFGCIYKWARDGYKLSGGCVPEAEKGGGR